jgi:hypothetical protein
VVANHVPGDPGEGVREQAFLTITENTTRIPPCGTPRSAIGSTPPPGETCAGFRAAPVRLHANLHRRAFVRARAHRNTLLESAASGLHSSSSARRAGLRAGQVPRRKRQAQHMTIDTTPTPASVTRVELDPRSLLVDVNIRTDARLDKEFVASIKDLGVLVPITAVRTTRRRTCALRPPTNTCCHRGRARNRASRDHRG